MLWNRIYSVQRAIYAIYCVRPHFELPVVMGGLNTSFYVLPPDQSAW